MKMEPTVSSKTSAIRTQTPGNYPKRNKLHLEHGESLKTRILVTAYFTSFPGCCCGLVCDHRLICDTKVGRANALHFTFRVMIVALMDDLTYRSFVRQKYKTCLHHSKAYSMSRYPEVWSHTHKRNTYRDYATLKIWH